LMIVSVGLTILTGILWFPRESRKANAPAACHSALIRLFPWLAGVGMLIAMGGFHNATLLWIGLIITDIALLLGYWGEKRNLGP
jgi:hypothetical protein